MPVHIDRIPVWDCATLEIKRDAENGCLEVFCRGASKRDVLHFCVWGVDTDVAPELKIDPALVDPPTTRATVVEILNESLAKDAFTHIEDMSDEGSEG